MAGGLYLRMRVGWTGQEQFCVEDKQDENLASLAQVLKMTPQFGSCSFQC